jgi:hypothetical protein
MLRFFETAAPVDARCAKQFNPRYGVGRFALRAGRSPDAIGRAAWSAAYDGIQRSFRMGGDTGAGLRGGSFTVDEGTFTYDSVRFTADVAVSGTAALDGPDVVADLTVDGPGDQDGTLHVAGRLFPHTSPLRATGRIGGVRVKLLVPTA